MALEELSILHLVLKANFEKTGFQGFRRGASKPIPTVRYFLQKETPNPSQIMPLTEDQVFTFHRLGACLCGVGVGRGQGWGQSFLFRPLYHI